MSASTNETCRDSAGFRDQKSVVTSACASCFQHLHHTRSNLVAMGPWLVAMESGKVTLAVKSDYRNESCAAVICADVSADDCRRWMECCEDAEKCCEQQATTPAATPSLGNNSSVTREGWCAQTWDGFACWPAAVANSVPMQRCPSFLTAMPDTRGKRT